MTNSGYSFDANGSQTAAPGIFSSAGYNLLDQTSTITPTGHAALSLSYQGLAQAHRVGAGAITYANDQLGLNEETGSPETEYIRDNSGVILGERINTSHYYFLFDGLGSVTAATDSTGTIVRTFAYDPYGNTTSSTGTIYEPIRYAGGYLDTHPDGNGPSLYKFGQRYYDPTSGRWTQPDPLNNPLALHGWNGYDYAGDDPINSIDPSGMGAVSPCVSIKYRETHRQCLHRNGNCKVGKALVGIGVVGVGSLIGVLHIVAGASEIAGGAAEGGVGEIVAGPIGAAEVIKGGGFIASSVTVGGYLIHQSHC